MKVGLVGLSCESGAGNNSKRHWRKLPFTRWLAAARPDMGYGSWDDIPRQEDVLPWARGDLEMLDAFLHGLDTIVCYQKPPIAGLFSEARARKIKTVLLTNAEIFEPQAEYATNADLLVLRTQDGARVIGELGFAQKIAVVPCPLDLDELPFRERTQAKRFVFSNGACHPHNRKGFRQVIAAVELGGLEALTVFTQRQLYDNGEARLEAAKIPLMSKVETALDLYKDADVALAPSRFEGVGLAVLEAMACGVPCLTTNHPPMNDYVTRAFAERAAPFLLDVESTELVHILGKPYLAANASPASIQTKMKALEGTDISWYSRAARRYIETYHGESAWTELWKVICSV